MFSFHETERYHVTTDRFGFALVTRKTDGASVYLQGDDADTLISEIVTLNGRIACNERRLNNAVDLILSEYDHVMTKAGE